MSDEARPFASLSSSLLARRGMARPAMRPQAIQLTEGGQVHPLDDLGWNDMGEEPVLTHPVAQPVPMPGVEAAPQPVPSPVVVQQEEIRRSFAPRAHAPVSAPHNSAKGKAAFTLRIDADRHLKLRLLCALQNRSAQQLLTQALDTLLDAHVDQLPTTQSSHNPQGNQS
jgi:hypothetical protein